MFNQVEFRGETRMKKALVFTVLLSIGLGFGVAQAADLTVNDGYHTYDCYYAATVFVGFGAGPILLYGLTVRGTSTVGWLTYQSDWGAFKIIVLEDNDYWGWSLDGHWVGNGSQAWGGLNSGMTITRNIYAGALKPGQQPPQGPSGKK